MANPFLGGSKTSKNPFLSKASSGNPFLSGKKDKDDELKQLKKLGKESGLDIEKMEEKYEPDASLFSKSMDLLSRGTYASAGTAKALMTGENPLEEAWKGLKGEDKETYSDVLETAGVENKYVRGGLGFVLDVALDPTTYFGGALIKGGLKTAGKVAKPLGKAYAKTAPESAKYFEAAGKNLKDALGSALVYGYGVTKGLADDVSRIMNKMGIAKEDVIDQNMKIFGKGVDRTKLKEATELMIENRRLERAARQGGEKPKKIDPKKFKKSADPEVNRLMEEMKNKGKEIAKKAGIEDGYEYYFPFLKKSKLKKIEESSGVLQKGGEGYRKEFKNLIKDEDLLKKPIEAYSRREFQVVRDKIVKSSLNDMVRAYGKSKDAFKNADEAAEAGYKMMKDKQFGKEVGYLKEQDAKFINDYLFPEFKAIDYLAKSTGYDQFTRWFKTAVTSWFPAFHVRNYISGNIQNYSRIGSQAFNPKNHNTGLAILKGVDDIVELGGKKYNVKELNRVMKENFRGASRYISDIDDYIQEVAGKNFKVRKLRDPGRKAGNFIEMQQKAVAMTAALRKGKSLKQAIKIAEDAGFDYSKITKFEQKIMRRLVPFYTFARKNAELQLKTLKSAPERILNQKKFADALSNAFGENVTEEDLKGLPEWVLNGLGFKVEGEKYVSQLGIPLEEFMERVSKPGKTTLSSLNPIVKFPLESTMGKDFFRDKELLEINKIAPASGELLWNAKQEGQLPDWLEQTINIDSYVSRFDGERKYTMSPRVLHVLRNLPTSRLQNTLEKMFDKDMDKVNKFMAFFSGGKVYDIDTQKQKFFREKSLKDDIENELLQRGVGRKFEQFYIPD